MKKAAFKIGQKLKYLGQRTTATMVNKKLVPIMFNGMEVTIIETHPPRKGYGFIKYDDEGEAIIDHDDDGYNIYENAAGQRRILWPKYKKEWERIKINKATSL
jgi:hypothetical protein